jgi:hypothetical protein
MSGNRILFITLIVIAICNLSMATFSACTSYSSTETENWRIRKEFSQIEKTWDIVKSYGKTTKSDTYAFITETLNVENITLVKGSHNFANAAVTLDKSNSLVVTGTDTFNFEFSFDYNYSYIRSGKGTGTAKGSSKSYVLTKTWDKLSIAPQVTITVVIDTATITLNGDYQTDGEVMRLSNVAIGSYFQSSLDNNLGVNLAEEANKFYAGSSTKNVFSMTTTFPQIILGIDANTDTAPKNLEKGVVAYNNFDITIGPVMKSAVTTWDSFNEDDAPHQIFVHQSFFQSVLSETTKQGKFTFTVNNINKPSTVTSDFNVETLGKFYPSKDKLY